MVEQIEHLWCHERIWPIINGQSNLPARGCGIRQTGQIGAKCPTAGQQAASDEQ